MFINRYSLVSKILHLFLLNYKHVRQTSFELETAFFRCKPKNNDINVFISGMARSGTTSILNELYKTNEFASLNYSDMPFLLAPNLWSKIRFGKEDKFIERAHGDGILINNSSPEAFEEVFWKTFSENNHKTLEKYKLYLEMIKNKNKRSRYLGKNNQNLKRLNFLVKGIPNSIFLIPFRDPLQQSFSLLNQHKKFLSFAKKDKFVKQYMHLIGHTEFGPNYTPLYDNELQYDNYFDLNHWLEQWYRVYKFNYTKFNLNKNTFFVCYETLCNCKTYWENIREKLQIKNIYEANFKETKKEVNTSFNENLLAKCKSLYDKIKNNCIF